MKNGNLAIAIPTYNRPGILEENILSMFEDIKKYSIPIYISDDSTNSETEKRLSDLRISYQNISYKRNIPSLGHDLNFASTLLFPTEKYIWYLGDSMIINPGGIERVLEHIEKYNPDFISVNATSRNLNINSCLYNDGNILLNEIGWHLTMTGVTIYSKRILDQISLLDLSKCTNFPQTALIFNCFASIKCNLYWENEKLITGNSKKQSYWEKNVFKTFFIDWINCINNLSPEFSIENKKKAMIAHSKNSGVFNFKCLINYRYKGFFGWKEFLKYFKMLKKHSNVNILLIAFIVLVPRIMYSIIMLFIKRN